MAKIERALLLGDDGVAVEVDDTTLLQFIDLDAEDFEDWREVYTNYYVWMIVREIGNPATVVSLGRPLTHAETDDLVAMLSSGWQGPFEFTTGGFPQPCYAFETSCQTIAQAAEILHSEAERTKYVFHATFADRIESIAASGLLPGQGNKAIWEAHHPNAWSDVKGKLFFLPTLEDAETYAEWLAGVRGVDMDTAIYLRVDRKDVGHLNVDFSADEHGGTWTTNAVAPEAIEVFDGADWGPTPAAVGTTP